MPTQPTGDFDGPQLVLSDRPMHAVRSWNVDPFGRLTAVSYTAAEAGGIWRPGENVAVCGRYDASTHFGMDMRHCTCGYYAYHKPDAVTPGEVRGIIRYSGETVIGTRGVRTKRAEIVALIRPGRVPSMSSLDTRLGWSVAALACAAVVATCAYTIYWAVTRYPHDPPAGIFALFILCILVGVVAGFFTIGCSCELGERLSRTSRSTSELAKSDSLAARFERARANYPDVPVFSSTRRALRAFPVVAPEPARPQVPTPTNSPDFWTATNPTPVTAQETR
jgi:hypothetical protein